MSFIKKYVTPNKEAIKRQSMAMQEKRRTMMLDHSKTVIYDEKGGFESPETKSITSSEEKEKPYVSTRPIVAYPPGDFRNNNRDDLRDIQCDVMVNFLYQQQMEMLWTAGGEDEGVVLKKSRGEYTCCPPTLMDDDYGFYKAIEMLNVRSAMTVSTRVIKLFLHNNDKPFVPLKGGLRLQVLPDITFLPRCQKHQFAAFIADRGILIVWDDEPKNLLNRAENIEKRLMHMIWGSGEEDEEEGTKKVELDDIFEEYDGIERADPRKPRRPCLVMPFSSACTLALTTICIGLGFQKVAFEIATDHYYVRLCFILVAPIQFWLGLFFFQALVGNIFQLIGPISQMNANTKYYSGTAPKRMKNKGRALPHVTIQMPVYKEGLTAVIEPTIHSIKAAISTYEMQGGTANVFINDDGMQLISEEEARARQDFYDEHNIGWVARPGHDPEGKKGEPFTRRGKFKKASNMNYAMWVSTRVEEKLALMERGKKWTQEKENAIYKTALTEIVEEDQGRTWADGNIRIGDYILIIDSDTRVPVDCFLDAVSEMEHSQNVGILQYSSGVMNVTDNFFERGITFFTNLVYTQIKYAVASGDVAPFVGHNAVIRWTAVQSIGYDDELDGREKWWSEETVSEDFDMALRLQSAGYLVRLAGYTGDGFKEGVSLTVYDELARWEKYAYGCSELIFHPLYQWPKRGIFTKLFKDFVVSVIPFPSKLTIMAYIGTYYALASAWALTLANYFLIGWFNGHLDKYYLNSFQVYVALVAIFTILGNFTLAMLRYRIEEEGLLKGLIKNASWIPLLTIFLGGNSIHVSQALLSHLFHFDMSWGATAKEVTNTSFFEEIPKVLKNFKGTLAFSFFCYASMIIAAFALPPFWQIYQFIAIWPLVMVATCHLLLPIALNPNLMMFTF